MNIPEHKRSIWLSLEQYHAQRERALAKAIGYFADATYEEMEQAEDTEEEHQVAESWQRKFI